MDLRVAYNSQYVLVDSLYIEDIGNCCLCATDEDGCCHILILVTKLGKTDIYEFGPIVPDAGELIAPYGVAYSRRNYDEDKLERYIQSWAVPKKNNYTAIKQITLVDAMSMYLDPLMKLHGGAEE